MKNECFSIDCMSRARPHKVFFNGSMPNDSFPLLERAASIDEFSRRHVYQCMAKAIFLITEECRKYRLKLFSHHSRK